MAAHNKKNLFKHLAIAFGCKVSSAVTCNNGNFEELSDEEHGNIDSASEANSNFTPTSSVPLKRMIVPAPPPKKKPRLLDDEELHILPKTEQKSESSVTTDDPFDTYGKHIADRLRQMNRSQIKFVQKLFSDVLFEGEMECLNRNSRLTGAGQRESFMPPMEEAYLPFFQRMWAHQILQPQQFAQQRGSQEPETVLTELGSPNATSLLDDSVQALFESKKK